MKQPKYVKKPYLFPEQRISEIKKPVKMPKEVTKPKPKKKVSKLIQTGKEKQSNALTDEAEKVASGNSGLGGAGA